MPLEIPLGFAQISIPLTNSQSPRSAFVTFGIDITNAVGSGGELADDALGVFANAFGPSIDSNVTMGPAYVLVGGGGSENLPYTGTDTAPGARVEESANSSVAALLRKVTGRPGRRGRGRMYIPWLLADTNVNEVGALVPAVIQAVNDNAYAFLNGLRAANPGIPMVLLHTKNDTDPPGVVYTPTVVDAMLCDDIIGIQRRRLAR